MLKKGKNACIMLELFLFRPAAPCKEKYKELNDVDICSPIFNFKRAVAIVTEQQDRQVCDVLLDQLILPGVGNIIKNEVGNETITVLLILSQSFVTLSLSYALNLFNLSFEIFSI